MQFVFLSGLILRMSYVNDRKMPHYLWEFNSRFCRQKFRVTSRQCETTLQCTKETAINLKFTIIPYLPYSAHLARLTSCYSLNWMRHWKVNIFHRMPKLWSSRSHVDQTPTRNFLNQWNETIDIDVGKIYGYKWELCWQNKFTMCMRNEFVNFYTSFINLYC